MLSYGDKFTYTEMVMNANWMSAKLSSSKLTWSGTGTSFPCPLPAKTNIKLFLKMINFSLVIGPTKGLLSLYPRKTWELVLMHSFTLQFLGLTTQDRN